MAAVFRAALVAAALGLCACPESRVPRDAKLLYDVTFSAPEQTVDTEVKTLEPTSEKPFPTPFPTRIFFGSPTVVGSLCGMTQPARLSVATAKEGLEGLEFLFDQRYRSYHFEVDLCVDRIAPPPLEAQAIQVGVFFDISAAHAIGFTANGEIVFIDPNVEERLRGTPVPIGRFEVGKPMRLTVDLDLPVETQSWRIAVDGVVLREARIRANIPRAVRFVVRGNPVTVAAFDNVLIWGEHYMGDAEPEPAPAEEPKP